MDVVAAIRAKREGRALEPGIIRDLISGYSAGTIPDYQMSAFLMAGFLRGFDEAETAALLDAMLHSGRVLPTRGSAPRIDKHSTGGVGDKVSLILAPLAAACGLVVPMISGRGLGHTGGTLDKMESIPGFNTRLSVAEMDRQLDAIGVVMMGQTDDIAPADRSLYALRDVTATVESIPLIAASILSKKLAAGLNGLVLDVKCGVGAFMETESDARRLAETLVGAASANGCPATALLTRMDTPLGRAVGNWPEVCESIDCLRGEGPADLREVVVALTADMVLLGEQASSMESARALVERRLDDGSAHERFLKMVDAQGGDAGALENPSDRPVPHRVAVHAPDGVEGVVAGLHARRVGEISVAIGAGRAKKEDDVDPLAGIYLNKLPGDPVTGGSQLATLVGSDPHRLQAATARILNAYRIAEAAAPPEPLCLDRYSDSGWESGSTA